MKNNRKIWSKERVYRGSGSSVLNVYENQDGTMFLLVAELVDRTVKNPRAASIYAGKGDYGLHLVSSTYGVRHLSLADPVISGLFGYSVDKPVRMLLNAGMRWLQTNRLGTGDRAYYIIDDIMRDWADEKRPEGDTAP